MYNILYLCASFLVGKIHKFCCMLLFTSLCYFLKIKQKKQPSKNINWVWPSGKGWGLRYTNAINCHKLYLHKSTLQPLNKFWHISLQGNI